MKKLPVRFGFEEAASRPEAWGRLEEIAAAGCRLLTRFEVRRRERLFLHIELGGERLEADACALSVREDEDGWKVVELRFDDSLTRERVGRVVRELLARA